MPPGVPVPFPAGCEFPQELGGGAGPGESRCWSGLGCGSCCWRDSGALLILVRSRRPWGSESRCHYVRIGVPVGILVAVRIGVPVSVPVPAPPVR